MHTQHPVTFRVEGWLQYIKEKNVGFMCQVIMPRANTYMKLLLNGGWTIPLRTRSWMNWLPCVSQLLRALQGPFLFSVAFSSPPLCCQRYFDISFKNNQRNIVYCTCGCTLKQPLQTLLECLHPQECLPAILLGVPIAVAGGTPALMCHPLDLCSSKTDFLT